MKNHIVFLHPPSVLDFRDRDDVLFAYLSNSESVSISPVYEMYPLGMEGLHQNLLARGYRSTLTNLALKMLYEPELDLHQFLKSFDTLWFGIDFHWLAHAQGAIALASLVKHVHPQAKVMVGGLSATLFHDQLIEHAEIDVVVRGVLTYNAVQSLIDFTDDPARWSEISDVTYRGPQGEIVSTSPTAPETYDLSIDWRHTDPQVNYFMLFSGAGCEYNCSFCGGSRSAMRRYFNLERGFISKSREQFLAEIQSMANHRRFNKRLITLHHWFEDESYLRSAVKAMESAKIHTAHFTLYHLLSRHLLQVIADSSVRPLFEVSIESHDPQIRRKCGKASYSNAELETWLNHVFRIIPRAIVEVYFMIGLPEQTPVSVFNEVEYAGYLLERYQAHSFNAYITPMRPFLDPGSRFYEQPEQHGYRLLFRSLEEYQQSLLALHWAESMNYETKWMNRFEFVDCTYAVCDALRNHRETCSRIPKAVSQQIHRLIQETVSLLHALRGLHPSDMNDSQRRAVRKYNAAALSSAASQQNPLQMRLYRYWFDKT